MAEGSGLGLCEHGQALSHPAPVKKRPTLPSSFFKFPLRSRLKVIQQMIYNPQPIKCVEAVFLALFLTAGILDADRIPLGFKSQLHGQVHQHIVLLVKYKNKYGAFGISRQHNLMSKEFEFESISSIVDDFRKAYEQYEHKVLRIRVGLPVEHNLQSFNFVCWRHLSLDPSSVSWEQCSEALERHANHAKRLWERWLLDGQRENRRAGLVLKDLDGKPTVALHEKSLRRRQTLECSSAKAPTVKAVKRRQEPDKQEPDSKVVKRRQALPALGGNRAHHQPSTTSQVKALPPGKNSPRDRPKPTRRCSQCQSFRNEALCVRVAHKENVRKIALKCYSVELFSGSCVQANNKKPKMNQDKRDLERAKQTPRKPAQPSRKS